MKKLMIGAAIVCAAVVAQAGAVKWCWTGAVQNGYLNEVGSSATTWDGKAAQAGTMYIFNLNGDNATTQQAVLTAFLAGTDISTLGAMDNYTAGANGMMLVGNAKTIAASHTDFADRVDGTTHYADTFLAMIVDDNIFITDTYTGTVGQSTAATTLNNPKITTNSLKNFGETATFSAGGWYTAAVPEPTSGLLLLLGVAGLALRRRRA